MSQNDPHRSDDTLGGLVYEFVDVDHPLTEEDRNRPRYGRPLRSPQLPPPEATDASNTKPTDAVNREQDGSKEGGR